MTVSSSGEFQFVTPRSTVEIHLPNKQVINGPRCAALGSFLKILDGNGSPPIVGGVVNGELRELTFPIKMDCAVRPVSMGEADGMRIYRRSLTFLLEAAFNELFPNAVLAVDHSVSSGGYFCQVSGRDPLSPAELEQLQARMQALVDADLPFTRKELPLEEAVGIFEAAGLSDKTRLLAHRRKNYLTVYELQGNLDYHHGYMTPSTGYLRWFALEPTGEGFTLRFPRRHEPTNLLPMPEYPKLLVAFRQYGDWLQKLGISSVGQLDDAIQAGKVRELILVAEALHEQRVTEIAAQIAARSDQVKIVLIAGPSSSGKTTFAKRLSVQLLAHGLSPFPLEMDHYFIDRDLSPRDENGQFDFESIRALNTTRMADDLRRLVAGELVTLPRYNFIRGVSEEGEQTQLRQGDLIILEGIHGLNPELLSPHAVDSTFRVYVSALTQLNLDRHNRVSTTDTRLIRRIARDARERGYSAQVTIQRWESVRRGEKRYIFPYQENADVMFNSALAYELSALKPIVEPLLRQVPYWANEYVEAKRLLAFLEWFLPLESDLIPDNSILKEFIGNSILRDFKLWHNSI